MLTVTAATLVLLAVVSVVVPAPAPEITGHGEVPGEAGQSQQRRVARQVPGLDILGQITETFQQQVQQKQERVMDVVDQVGKVLGSIGDSVHQVISDRLADGADGGSGQRVAGAGEAGQVLSSIGDKLRQVVAERASGGLAGDVSQGLEAGRKVGDMLVSVLRKAINQDKDDDEGVARLVSRPPPRAEALVQPLEAAVACRNGTMAADGMGVNVNMPTGRGGGRGRRAAPAPAPRA